MRNITYKFRLFPNINQERSLDLTLETHRRLYNACLQQRKETYETSKQNLTSNEQCKWFTKQKKQNAYFALINSKSAERTLQRLDQSFQDFFRRIRKKQKPGFPRFKSRDRFNSFGFANENGCKIINDKLRLQFIGNIRVRWHREFPKVSKIKNIQICREGKHWFVCFNLEIPDPIPSSNLKKIGIDLGLTSFITTSKGKKFGNSRILENVLPELRRKQRALSRCKLGSNRRKKVKELVTNLHQKVRNTRKDLHHKVARSLVNRYGTIAAESLNIKGMLRNRWLARRISDAGWGTFIGILKSKAENAGKQVILVNPKNTSQQCSQCGKMVKKSLSVRVHKCKCGLKLDRDWNAAKNILARAVPEGRNGKVTSRGLRSRLAV